MLRWIANRTLLAPSTHPIDTAGKRRETISVPFGIVEAWTEFSAKTKADLTAPPLVILKFPGMAGRAERATLHPLDYWSHRSGAVWSINPPGYGQSTGPAWIERFPTAAQATWLHLKHLYPKAKIIVTGNSLGTAIALFIAARFQPDGLLLRNPPPIRQLICQRPRYNWWNLGAAKYIARQFPQELDSIENAKSCRCPALFVQSGQDSLVPIEFQNRIIHAYSGKQKTLVLGNANHDTPVLPEQETDYRDALTWLEQQALTRID